MRLICPKCSARYNVADELVQGRNFRVSCKECGTTIRGRDAEGEAPADTSGGAGLPPVPAWHPPAGGGATDLWFLVVDGKPEGPLFARQVAERMDAGVIGWTCPVWRPGLKGWRAARRDAVLVTAVASARGRASIGDTLKLEPSNASLPQEDTVVDAAPRAFGSAFPGLGRARRAAEPVSEPGPASGSDTHLMDESELPFSAALATAGATARQRPVVSSSPAYPSPAAVAPPRRFPGMAENTLADAFTSAPALLASQMQEVPGEHGGFGRGSRAMLLLALGSFAAGALVAGLWGLLESAGSADANLVVAPGPAKPETTRPASAAEPTPVSPEDAAAKKPEQGEEPELASAPAVEEPKQVLLEPEPLRELPRSSEIRAAVRTVAPQVRRCLRNPQVGVDLAIHIDGPSGRVRQVLIRRPALPPGRTQCVRHAVRQMQLAPFARPNLRLLHKFAWRG